MDNNDFVRKAKAWTALCAPARVAVGGECAWAATRGEHGGEETALCILLVLVGTERAEPRTLIHIDYCDFTTFC